MTNGFGNFLRHRRAPLVISLVIFALALAAIFGVFRIVQTQRDFEMQRWQTRLNERGEASAKSVEEWLTAHRKVLASAAVNPTIQIYLSELALNGFDQSKVQANDTKRGYVGSYIAALGSRSPFTSTSETGVGLFSADKSLVASSPDFLPAFDSYFGTSSKPGSVMVGQSGSFLFAQAVPAMPIPPAAAFNVGYLVARAKLDPTLIGELNRKSDANGGVWLFKRDADQVWQLEFGESTEWQKLDPSSALQPIIIDATDNSGKLQSIDGLEAGGELLLSIKVPGSDLVIVAHVARAQALAGVTEHLRSLLLNLLFALLALIALIYAFYKINAVNEKAREQEQKIGIYWTLAELLLDVIDQRNPGAAAHSRRVSELTSRLMHSSGAKDIDAEVAKIAGAFLNVGKLFVPAEVLAKTGSLDDAERERILEGNRKWLDLLSSVSTDLPVVPVLLEAHEIMEGQRHISDQTSLAARAIVVANGYVALTSPRSYRDAKTHQEALDLMRSDASKDAKLVNFLAAA